MTTSRIARNWWCNTNPPLYQLCHTKNRDGNCPDYEPKTDASTRK